MDIFTVNIFSIQQRVFIYHQDHSHGAALPKCSQCVVNIVYIAAGEIFSWGDLFELNRYADLVTTMLEVKGMIPNKMVPYMDINYSFVTDFFFTHGHYQYHLS